MYLIPSGKGERYFHKAAFRIIAEQLGDSPAISPPPYCTEFEYGDFLAPGPRRQYVVVLRNGPLRGRCYYLTGLYLLFICPTCLVIALELQ